MIDRLKRHGKLYLDGWRRVAAELTPKRTAYAVFLVAMFTALLTPWVLGFAVGWFVGPSIGLSNLDGGVTGVLVVSIFGWLPYYYGSMWERNR